MEKGRGERSKASYKEDNAPSNLSAFFLHSMLSNPPKLSTIYLGTRNITRMKLNRKLLKITAITIIFFCLITATYTKSTQAWGNGGYSADSAKPDYGKHDWIAQHALDFLPPEEKQFITDNLQTYLYATEMPDNPQFIGDTSKHHIYFSANETLQDDAAAARAEKEFQNALTFLKFMDYSNASLEVGIMSHYIADVSVFGHVMG